MTNLDRFSELPTTPGVAGVDLSDINDGNHKIAIFGTAKTNPPRTIIIPGGPDPESVFYSLATISPDISTVGVYSFHSCQICGLAFPFLDGKLIDEADLIPAYVRHDIDLGQQWDLNRDLPIRIIDGTAIVVVSNAYLVYGHWLLDILPRVWMAKLLLKDISQAKFIIPRGTPNFAIRIMKEFFDLTDFIYHEINSENLQIEHALIPSLLHNDHHFHPAMNDFVTYLLRHPLVVEIGANEKQHPKRVYVTRRRFRDVSKSYVRTIINEDLVLDLMIELGFEIVSPEALEWQDQIALFANAQVIIGEAGSGLHNTIFSGASATVICLNPANQVQSSIAGLRGHTIIIQCSQTEETKGANLYQVDLERLRNAALKALGSTAEFLDQNISTSNFAREEAEKVQDQTPSFFWQFRRPLSRLGGTFARTKGEQSDDIALVERVISAYRSALRTNVGPKSNIWFEHFAAHNSETHEALAEGTTEQVATILRDPAASDLFWGFDGPTATDVRTAAEPFSQAMTERYAYDALTSLAEALGAERVENPEAVRCGDPISADVLLGLIDDALGVKVKFPNPFRDESGIATSRGVVSHRAAMALYQAWRIVGLVGNDGNARILEIGAGLGRNAYFAHQLGARNYAIVDLPTTNVAQGYFLGRVLGQEAVKLYGEERSAYVEIMPSEQFFRGTERYDLIANIDSMTEFSEETARAYLTQAAGRSGSFLSINHEANHFTIRQLLKDINPSMTSSRTPSWIRQGYIEEVTFF